MKPYVNLQKMQTAYKKPNPNFAQQLCTFLSQSKHQKQQQINQINQYMVEQFIHLFEFCNINRYIDYTPEFIDQIRNIILRLEIVQKKQFECFDQKDQYMYLMVEGKVQKVQRKKPMLGKRVTRMNMTTLNFGATGSLVSSFNPRASHQAFNNIQLREFERSMIMNRNSRMSMMMSGNLWSQMVASPVKKHRTEDKLCRTFNSFSSEHHRHDSPLRPKSNRLREKIQQEEQHSISSTQKLQTDSNQFKVQLLQPLQHETYHCMTRVKYIKLLKWSYDQLVQYIFKYQNDRLIQFLSKSLLIPQHQIKLHQIYNKTAFNYYQERQSRHSNQYIGLDHGSIYILRKGSVEFKYECKVTTSMHQNTQKSPQKDKKNPNLADYVNYTQANYKKVILNQGAIICPELQKNTFFVQAVQNTVFIEINNKLLEYLKQEMKNNWWAKKFLSNYKIINQERALYMKDEQIRKEEVKTALKIENVFIETKNRRLHSAKVQKNRFRKDIKPEQNNNLTSLNQLTSQNKQNQPDNEFGSQQYREFISLLPYQIMVKSKQKISMKLNQKIKTKHISDKVFNYLKKNQKGNSSSKYQNKLMELKMKNIAAKQMNVKDLDNIYADINKNSAKKQFHKSLKGNWFKEQTDMATENSQSKALEKKTSSHSDGLSENPTLQRKGPNSCKSNTQIIALNKRFNDKKKMFTINTMQSTEYDERKVTFALNNMNTLDDSSEEEYLCSDDTGLINKFVQKSHNYQKQISFLINSSQREDKYQNHKKKLKTCKTQGNNMLFSHNLINEIMKRVNTGSKTKISSHKNSKKPSNVTSVCPSVCNDQQNQRDTNQQDKKSECKNQSNLLSQILSQLQANKIQIPDQKPIIDETLKQKQYVVQQTNFKEKKTSSFTNYSSSKSSSSKFLKPNNRSVIPLSYNRKTYTESKEKENKDLTYAKSSFFEQKGKRPMTAGETNGRLECKSVMFNQWIETEPSAGKYKDERNSDLGVANFNFCQRNISSGDKKIWKRLKSGKIVKKSVKYYTNKNNSSHWGTKPAQIS